MADSFVTQELNLSDTSSRLDYWNSSLQLSNKPRKEGKGHRRYTIVTLKLFESRTEGVVLWQANERVLSTMRRVLHWRSVRTSQETSGRTKPARQLHRKILKTFSKQKKNNALLVRTRRGGGRSSLQKVLARLTRGAHAWNRGRGGGST